MKIPIIDTVATAKRIRELKELNGYSARAIQKACCLETVQAVYNWFYGKKLPSIDNLVVLAYIFKVPIDGILVVNYIDTEGVEDYAG